MSKPIVWTIAGSDSGGGAGIQADLHTFQALGVHGCSVITALTAQNSKKVHHIDFTSPQTITAQLDALSEDLPPRAIKLGMLGSVAAMQAIIPVLDKFPQAVIYDPVLFASVGEKLFEEDSYDYLVKHFLPRVTLLTPNISETEWLLKRKVISHADIETAANDLLAMGPKAILIKGGHATSQGEFCQDYWTDGKQKIWLTNKRVSHPNRHGSGCTLASAISAALAQDYSLSDALVIAKTYVNQGMRNAIALGEGPGPISHGGWPEVHDDLPWLSKEMLLPTAFPSCGPQPLGFYPVVDSSQWIERMLVQGVKTLQLRIKSPSLATIEEEIKTSITLARQFQARLFINDYWELALKHGAYGVHLGQGDLDSADCAALLKAGIRLGISTHCYTEVARAHALRPSYIAMGPVYPTTSKIMPFLPQGLIQLTRYVRTLNYPLVAIGGINWERLPAVWHTGVDGVAVITAITLANNPDTEAKRWVDFFGQ